MATERQQRKYPVGIQTFQKLREGNYLYIDKTEYVYRMAHSNTTYMFLSRPRRFGKSLLTSTLRSYFEGRRELFKGLAIEKLESEWAEYPVLHFDMSTAKHQDKEELELELAGKLAEYEKTYGREPGDVKINQRLNGLIRHAYEQTKRKVVVLIDEYDAPLLDVVHEEENLPALRNIMRNFYSPLKACDPYLRFVFMTGITKFSQLSIFSELNNIRNISMLPEYAAVCGITKEEMTEQMSEDIELLAQRRGTTKEQTLHDLTDYYDGYHFTWPSPDVFNPYSIMNAFCDGMINAYWFGSGTPTYLVEMLRKFHVPPMEIGGRKCIAEDFDAPTERIEDITPLLYQSGYITIKDYNPVTRRYTLDIPNVEVRIGLMRSLLINYVRRPVQVNNLVAEMYENIYYGKMDGALKLMQTVLSALPYCDNANTEGHYQQLLAIIFILLSYYVDVEVHTSTGRVDMVMKTRDTLYLMELKLDKSAEAAMRQIDLKDYSSRFSLTGLPIVKVAVNFDSEKRTISDWKIERQTTLRIMENENNTINGHEYVDLGLSVKWATCNVGAGKPEQYGDYFAWGETETKSSYDDENCETFGNDIGDIKGTARDVAHVKWGGTWRMPTRDEIKKLLSHCKWTWTTLNSVNGYKVTGKNGKSIFLPAAGDRGGTSLRNAGSHGYYWSSTPHGSLIRHAYGLNFGSGDHDWSWLYRGYGRSVRPVSE